MSIGSFIAGGVAGSTISVAVTVVLQPQVERAFSAAHVAIVRPMRMRSAQRYSSKAMMTNQLEYYNNRGLSSNIYTTSTVGLPISLPMTFDSTVEVAQHIRPNQDDLAGIIEREPVTLPVSTNIIARRERQGVHLFDGKIAYIREVKHISTGEVWFGLGVCNYYAFVTRIEKLRRAVARKDTKLLDATSQTLRQMLTLPESPTILGCTCVSVFECAGGRRVALQRRSSEVITWASAGATIPIFGLESNILHDNRSNFGIVTYNFLKEFLEEFYNLEKLFVATLQKRADPDWIFKAPEAIALQEELSNGRLTLSCLGVGGDAQDGRIFLVVLAYFTSHEFYEGLVRNINASRETDSIKFVALEGSELVSEMTSGSMEPGSIMALDMTRAWFGISA